MILGEDIGMDTDMVPSAEKLEFFQEAHFEALD